VDFLLSGFSASFSLFLRRLHLPVQSSARFLVEDSCARPEDRASTAVREDGRKGGVIKREIFDPIGDDRVGP